jgi:hypothetical protein
MSPYSLEKLADQPVILWIASDTWDMSRDLPVVTEQIQQMLNETTEALFILIDTTQTHVTLSDVIYAANYTARLGTPILKHPKMREFLMVTNMRVVELAIKGLNSETFGNINGRTFPTREEAFAYVQSAS